MELGNTPASELPQVGITTHEGRTLLALESIGRDRACVALFGGHGGPYGRLVVWVLGNPGNEGWRAMSGNYCQTLSEANRHYFERGATEPIYFAGSDISRKVPIWADSFVVVGTADGLRFESLRYLNLGDFAHGNALGENRWVEPSAVNADMSPSEPCALFWSVDAVHAEQLLATEATLTRYTRRVLRAHRD